MPLTSVEHFSINFALATSKYDKYQNWLKVFKCNIPNAQYKNSKKIGLFWIF